MSVRAKQMAADEPDDWRDFDAETDVDDEPETGEEDGPPSESSDNERVTYLALEGVDPSEVTSEDRESIENQIAELLLLNYDYPLEKVRMITEDSDVMEVIVT